ncbi:hypothetical protein [Mycolicibacterium fortuitum]|uniref:hypothetical protein n=1 Tax=Mycolicibacterium fortuitum TaxID=1766 RepID=UPI002618588B|nr:hypothetical protein [Mycolicibacterium fortuitum]
MEANPMTSTIHPGRTSAAQTSDQQSGQLLSSRPTVIGLMVVVALAAGLCACSSPKEPSPQSVPASSATTSPPRLTRAMLPTGQDIYRNAATVYSGCIPDVEEGKAFGAGQIFDTRTGDNRALPTPTLAAGDELLNYACTVVTAPDGTQRVVHLVKTRTPSHGLTPETEQGSIVGLDAARRQTPMTRPLPMNIEDLSAIYPAHNGFIAEHTWANGTDLVAWFDANTLELKRQVKVAEGFAPQSDTQPIDTIPYNYDGYATVYSVRIPCADCLQPDPGFTQRDDLHIFDGPSGEEIGSFPNLGAVVPVDHGFLLEHRDRKVVAPEDAAPGVFYFDMRTKEMSGPIAPYLWTNGSARWLSNPAFGNAFVWGEEILLIGPDEDKGVYLKVWNRKDKKEVFSLAGPQLAGLKISGVGMGAGFLFLENDSDSPVIDLQTGQPVSSGWKLHPVAKLPDGWVVIKPSKQGDREGQFCISAYARGCPIGFSYPAGAYLARGADGDYTGPWF